MLVFLKSGMVRLRCTIDRSEKLDEISWNMMQQVAPHREEPLLDGNTHSVRYGGMIHDGSEKLIVLIPKKRQNRKFTSWEVTQQNL